MTAPIRVPTSKSDVLSAVAAQLVAASVFTPSTIFAAIDADAALGNPTSTIYGVLIPRRTRYDQRTIAGAARHATKATLTLDVVIFANINLDQGDRAEQWLKNSKGVIAKEDAVLDALNGFDPVDELSGNALFSMPMRVIDGSMSGKPGKYGAAILTFEIDFQQPLPTNNDSTGI